MGRSLDNGCFTSSYALAKQWRVDRSLFKALIGQIGLEQSVIDVGAGIGAYVRAFRDLGFDAFGLDGIEGIQELSEGVVDFADLSKPLSIDARDWGICIEVGEHIPVAQAATFLDNLSAAAGHGLIVSWAVPGQRGVHHVNCQPPDVIAAELVSRGWCLNQAATEEARRIAGDPWNKKLLVLRKACNGRASDET